MRIREIDIQRFMNHAGTSITFPSAGIVLITGPNGGGKSSTIEAVSVGLWGKTLRGSAPWQEGQEDASVVVLADGLRAVRSRKKTRALLDWSVVDDGSETGRAFDALARFGAIVPGALPEDTPPAYESTSQAQQALEKLVGSFDVWRRSCAFSSSDAAHFSLATDAERKRLLESILGLDRFDVALDKCRADLREQEKVWGNAAAQAQLFRESLAGEERRLADTEATAARAHEELPPELPMPSVEEMARLSKLYDAANADIARLKQQLRAADRTVANADADIGTARRELTRLSVDTCPTCEQPMPAGKRAAAKQALDATLERTKDAVDRANAGRTDIEAEIEELTENAASLRARHSSMDAARQVAEERAQTRTRAEKQHRQALAAVGTAKVRVAVERSKLADWTIFASKQAEKLGVLRAVEVVLGLRGVRAHVLANSLFGLATVANAWLPKLGLPNLGVELKPYSEKKSGGVTDAISVEVLGAGGGHGYKGASAGERRRVDLALLLGIAEIASAASGRTGSTLFFDELFDALDSDGVQAVVSALVDLAKDRCVVVITHNDELADRLPAARRLRIEKGKVIE